MCLKLNECRKKQWKHVLIRLFFNVVSFCFRVKERLHEFLSQDEDITHGVFLLQPLSLPKNCQKSIEPTLIIDEKIQSKLTDFVESSSVKMSIDKIKNPYKACQRLYELINSLIDEIAELMREHSRLSQGSSDIQTSASERDAFHHEDISSVPTSPINKPVSLYTVRKK